MKCPICGREKSPSLPFIEGICVDCYLKKTPIKPIKLKLKRCKSCGAIFLKGRWEPPATEKLETVEMKEAERELKKIFRAYGFEVVVTSHEGEFKAQLIGEEGMFSFPVTIVTEEERSLCPSCLAKRSGSYEAKIQVRSDGRVDRKTFKEVMDTISSMPYELREAVVSIEELKEGFDINIREKSSAKIIASALADKLGGEAKFTYKLVSERGGEKRTRLSISMRLPSEKSGDLVELNGEPALVLKKSGDIAKILLLSRRKEIKLSKIEKDSLRPFTGSVREVTVEAVLPDRVIVLTEDFSTEEVNNSGVFGKPASGEKYILVEHKTGKFLLSKELVL